MGKRTKNMNVFTFGVGFMFVVCVAMLGMQITASAQEQRTASQTAEGSDLPAKIPALSSSTSSSVSFLGLTLWQWFGLVLFILLAYIVSGWFVKLLKHLNTQRKGKMSAQGEEFLKGPVRFLFLILLVRNVLDFFALSPTARMIIRSKTLLVLAIVWMFLRTVDFLHDVFAERFRQQNQEAAMVLLRPIKGLMKIGLVILGGFVWLDNIGVNIATLLAGFSLGGAALALAAQDTLRNFFGSVMIFLDKPFTVGQRIITSGYEGVVESIGVRSTKLRLLNGHQVIISNDAMARANIENISRRPYLRRSTNIRVAPENSLEQVENAVEIIQKVLENHEGMQEDSPPRVYFNELNDDSYNIMVIYWYYPPDYWAFNAFNQQVNIQIVRGFEKESIQFAWPSITNFLAQHPEDKPFHMRKADEG